MLYQTLLVIGSLGFFLYGMKTMSDGIQKVVGERLQPLLNQMSSNRLASILTGVAITAIIQSSSATTVMVVSFVNAGLLQLTQAIGVIMGANIGTTVTGWLIALIGFRVSLIHLSLPVIGFGFLLMVVKRFNKRDLGQVFIGFGILFLGIYFLKNSIAPIDQYPQFFSGIQKFIGYGVLSYLFFIAIGILLTILLQASSAAMALTLALAYVGWIDYPTAAAIILGENIGTTLSANIASFGTSVNAKRAGRAHTLFNVFGSVWMIFLFPFFLKFVDFLIPSTIFGVDGNGTLPIQLAMFHTMFNLSNTVICFFFIPLFAKAVTKLVPGVDSTQGPYKLKYIRATLRETPEFYLLTVKRELLKMADITAEMFTRFWDIFSHPESLMEEEIQTQREMEDLTDQMQEEITKFLSMSSLDSMNQMSAKNVHGMIRITNELESIGDSCFNLMLLSERRITQEIEIDEEIVKTLFPYVDLVHQFLRFIRSHLNEYVTSENMAVAQRLEHEINTTRNTLKESATERLQQGSDVKSELLYIEIVRHMEQVGDHCLNIVESLAKLD